MCFCYVDETKWHWLLFIRRIIRTLQSKAMTFNTKMRFLFVESMWNIPETEPSTFSQLHKHMYDPNQLSLQWSVFCFRWQLKVSNYSAIASIIFSIMIISSALVRPEPKPSQAKPNLDTYKLCICLTSQNDNLLLCFESKQFSIRIWQMRRWHPNPTYSNDFFRQFHRKAIIVGQNKQIEVHVSRAKTTSLLEAITINWQIFV